MTTEIVEAPSKENGKLAFIASALERVGGADEAGKLVDMYMKLTKFEAERAYNQAMVRCQRRMEPVVKHKEGDRGIFFAPLESIEKQLRPIWLEEGFSLSTGTEDSTIPEHYRVVLHISHEGGDTRT